MSNKSHIVKTQGSSSQRGEAQNSGVGEAESNPHGTQRRLLPLPITVLCATESSPEQTCHRIHVKEVLKYTKVSLRLARTLLANRIISSQSPVPQCSSIRSITSVWAIAAVLKAVTSFNQNFLMVGRRVGGCNEGRPRRLSEPI